MIFTETTKTDYRLRFASFLKESEARRDKEFRGFAKQIYFSRILFHYSIGSVARTRTERVKEKEGEKEEEVYAGPCPIQGTTCPSTLDAVSSLGK